MATLRAPRRLAAWLLAVGCALGVVVLCWPGAAAAQEPDVAAWWSAANLGDPAPAPPPPPDVTSGDLFVQGSNAAPAAATPAGAAPGSAQAVAGLEFDLQPTDLVGALTLPIDGTPPPQVSVVACKSTGRFTDVENGPWSRVPAYDADACVPGTLADTKVVFNDVGKLVADAQLSVVLLPGPVDRVVFAKPGPGALQVTHAGTVGSSAPSFGTGTGGSRIGGSAGAGGGVPVAAPAAGGPASVGLPPSGQTSPDTGLAPVVAGSAGPSPAATAPAARPVAARSGLSAAARRWIALVVIALEVLGFAVLVRAPDPARVPTAGDAALAGGRLRPPDRGLPAAGAAAMVGGVGRFRRERRTAAPHV
ncbi:MAG TPA: hypothetical protein VFJ98_00210 [Mycobacteriales bacterium]|nr:hypothetical protein [Mycobacteriales bacterium]